MPIGNKLKCSHLGKTFFPTPRCSPWPIILFIGLSPQRFFFSAYTLVYTLMSYLFNLFEKSWWWDFMGVPSNIAMRYNLTVNPLIFCLLQSFFVLRLQCSLSLRNRSVFWITIHVRYRDHQAGKYLNNSHSGLAFMVPEALFQLLKERTVLPT